MPQLAPPALELPLGPLIKGGGACFSFFLIGGFMSFLTFFWLEWTSIGSFRVLWGLGFAVL